MYQIPLHRVVQLVAIHNLPIQQAPFAPPHLPTPLLVHEQPASQLLRLDVQEPGEFLQIHGRVELEVGFVSGGEHVISHLLHEDGKMVVHGVDVDGGVVVIGGRRGYELGGGGAEELF